MEVTGLDEAISKMGDFGETVEAGEGLLEVIQDVVMPELENASTREWNVRTGMYATGWEAEQTDPESVHITNLAQNMGYFYGVSLEFGWTTRGGGYVPSEGVAIPVVLETIPMVVEGLADWLKNRLNL